MDPDKRQALNEWRAHWPLVLAALVGGSFASLPIFSMTFFIEPLSDEFGWSRTQVSVGLSIFALVITPLSPFAGALVDRWGSRKVGLLGICLCSVACSALALTTGSFTLWVAQWFFYALADVCLKNTVWTAAVAGVFKAGRGMALALTLCGSALCQTIAPLLAFWLIDNAGWRVAYAALGLGWGGFAFILAVLFLFDARSGPRKDRLNPAEPRAEPVALGGLSVGEAVRSAFLYRITAAFAVSQIIGIAVIAHKVSILHDMDITRAGAAQIAATAGIAGISGKLITGWLYDRKFSPWISGMAFFIPVIGFALLTDPVRTPLLIVVGMIFIGFGGGAGLQVLVYLIARHAGLRNFGKIFGTITATSGLSIGLGPLVGGAIYDHFQSYGILIVLGIIVNAIAVVLVMWPSRSPDEPIAAAL